MRRRDFLTAVSAASLTAGIMAGEAGAQFAKFQIFAPSAAVTIDFNAATPGGCGCTNPANATNCTNAAIVWRQFVVANPGATLTLAAGTTYNMDFAVLIASDPNGITGNYPDTLNIPSCTIAAAAGTTFQNWSAWGSYEHNGKPTYINNMPNDVGTILTDGTGAFIATCCAGDSTITLLSSMEASRYIVGRWVVVCGIAISGLGFPSNYQRYEFHQITNVSGSVITLDSPLRKNYSSTWVNTFPTSGQATQGGAACVHTLGVHWNTIQVVQNIHALHSTTGAGGSFSAQPIRNITCNTCTWDEPGPGASVSQNVVLSNCTQLGFLIEMDKLVERIIIEGGTWNSLRFQSSTPEFLIIRNGCNLQFGFSDGTGNNLTLSDSTVGLQWHTGPGYGRSGALVITNSTYVALDFSFHGPKDLIVAGALTYHGSGLWILNTDNFLYAEQFYQSIVPGYQYAFGWGAEIYPDPQFTVPPIYFCVTDIYETTGPNTFNYAMQTDMTYAMGSLPTTTYLGHAWDNFMPIPYTSVTINGVPDTTTQFAATMSCPAVVDMACP